MNRNGLLSVLLVLSLAGVLAGCGVVPWVTNTIFGRNEKVKPKYEFPKGKTLLVFVESDPALNYLAGVELVRVSLANVIGEQLVENQAVASYVSQNRLQNVLEQLPELASIGEVGQRCGADFVLYVQIEQLSFQDVPNTTLYTGRMQTAVKVIDVTQGKVFPPVEAKYPLKEIKLTPTDDTSPTYTNVIAKVLAIKMGDNIAKLFYEHELPKNGDPMLME